jgi:hypothetical protein
MRQRHWLTGLWACLAAQGLAGAALPLFAGEPYPYSEEWWAMRAQDPPGARQVEKDGKLWPPFARPVGEKQHWVHKYHHAHYWPHPYNCEDQAYVRNILDQQASGGWISATTIRDYHFDADTQQLNSVGREHLYWIVTGTPAQYRTVYLAQSMAPAADALRQANIEQTIREFQPNGGVPVLVRPDRYLGRPAQEIDQLRRLELQSIPRPRLFTIGNRTGSSAGGGLGGAGASGSGSSGGGSGSGSGGGTTR